MRWLSGSQRPQSVQRQCTTPAAGRQGGAVAPGNPRPASAPRNVNNMNPADGSCMADTVPRLEPFTSQPGITLFPHSLAAVSFCRWRFAISHDKYQDDFLPRERADFGFTLFPSVPCAVGDTIPIKYQANPGSAPLVLRKAQCRPLPRTHRPSPFPVRRAEIMGSSTSLRPPCRRRTVNITQLPTTSGERTMPVFRRSWSACTMRSKHPTSCVPSMAVSSRIGKQAYGPCR